jgi:hypothetical protein
VWCHGSGRTSRASYVVAVVGVGFGFWKFKQGSRDECCGCVLWVVGGCGLLWVVGGLLEVVFSSVNSANFGNKP